MNRCCGVAAWAGKAWFRVRSSCVGFHASKLFDSYPKYGLNRSGRCGVGFLTHWYVNLAQDHCTFLASWRSSQLTTTSGPSILGRMMLVLFFGLVTFIAAQHYIRIFNSRIDDACSHRWSRDVHRSLPLHQDLQIFKG